MKPINSFLVQVEDEYNRRIGVGINGLPIEVSVTDRPYWHMQVSGIAIETPLSIPATHMRSITAGHPHPLKYYSGQEAAHAINELQQFHKNMPSVANIQYDRYKSYENESNKNLDQRLEARYAYDRTYRAQLANILNKVNCATFERPRRLTIRGYGTEDIRKGDQVLLRYSALSPYQDEHGQTQFLNFAFFKDGRPVYRVDAANIIGYSRNGSIKMVNGFVAVKPVPQQGITEEVVDGRPMMVKRSLNADLLIPVVEKATKLLGEVVHAPEMYRGFGHIKKGTKVFYTPDSEEKYTINGEELYVMRAWEIMASVETDGYRPVEDYVLLAPLSVRIETMGSVLIPENADVERLLTEGRVMKTGPMCQEVKAGQTAVFRGKMDRPTGLSFHYVEDQGWPWSVSVSPSMQVIARKGCVLVRESDLLAVVQ